MKCTDIVYFLNIIVLIVFISLPYPYFLISLPLRHQCIHCCMNRSILCWWRVTNYHLSSIQINHHLHYLSMTCLINIIRANVTIQKPTFQQQSTFIHLNKHLGNIIIAGFYFKDFAYFKGIFELISESLKCSSFPITWFPFRISWKNTTGFCLSSPQQKAGMVAQW